MRRLVVSLALLLGLARANEVEELSFEAKGCGAFRKSFDELGLTGRWTHLVKARCRIVDGVGAACTISNTGIPNLEETYLRGYFVYDENGVLKMVMKDGPIALIVMCKGGHCFDLKFWNTTSLVGIGCFAERTKEPKKEPPKVPTDNMSRKEFSAYATP